MCFRFSRLRFIIVRSCIISFIIILLLQIIAYFNNDDISFDKPEKLLTIEETFWKKLSNEDKDLSDQHRIQRLKSSQNQFGKEALNWTNIFYDSYQRKLTKLYERDSKTTLKSHFKENQTNISQQFFEIYEETLVFGNPKFCSSNRIFHPQCPYSNCQWKCQRPSINSQNLRRASIFHHVDIREDAMRKKLAHRSSNDIWILWIDEANREIEHLNQYKFNWTLSFRQDSEVSIGSYGILINRTKEKTILNPPSDFIEILTNANIKITDMSLENHILSNYRYRDKHALWFISNCGPERRLKYYEKLKNHYPIQAFGSCVEKKCDKNNHCESDQSYLALFYLAFESHSCTDYITEKFWRALYYGMIPIVLGPSKQSYLDLGVPKSAFIHIDDFQSEQALADYLHRISKDYFLYRKFFQWLNEYEIFYDIHVLEPIRMCELCMKLNMQDYQDHSFYINVHDWHRTEC